MIDEILKHPPKGGMGADIPPHKLSKNIYNKFICCMEKKGM